MNFLYKRIFSTVQKELQRYGFDQIDFIAQGHQSFIFTAQKQDKNFCIKISPLTKKKLVKQEAYWLKHFCFLDNVFIYKEFPKIQIVCSIRPWILGEVIESWEQKEYAMFVQKIAGMHTHTNNFFGFVHNSNLRALTWDAFLKNYAHFLLQNLKKTKNLDTKKISQYIEREIPRIPTLKCPHFVHGDLYKNNVLFRQKVYIIDFERSFWGDPIWDFAVFDFLAKLNIYDVRTEDILQFHPTKKTVIKEYKQRRDIYQLLWSLQFYNIGVDTKRKHMITFSEKIIQKILHKL